MEASSSTLPAPQQGGDAPSQPPATPSHSTLLPALSPSSVEQTPAPIHPLPQGAHSNQSQAAPQQPSHPHTLPRAGPQHPAHHSHPITQPQFMVHHQAGQMLPPTTNGTSHPQPSGNGNVFGAVMGSGPGQVPPQSPGPGNTKVYASVYSGIPVFEAMIRGISVMRRTSDSWVNATQILKVAGVIKSQRTKTLEKEIQVGLHEKVQGGYGKYQGTWIPLGRGRELAEQYGVSAYLAPIFEFSPDPASVAALPIARSETPSRKGAKTPSGNGGAQSTPLLTSAGRVASPFTTQPASHPSQASEHTAHAQQQQLQHPPAGGNGVATTYWKGGYFPATLPHVEHGDNRLGPAAELNGMSMPHSQAPTYLDQYGAPHPTYHQQQGQFVADGYQSGGPPAKRQKSNDDSMSVDQEYTNGNGHVEEEEAIEVEVDEEEESDDEELRNRPPLPSQMRLSVKPLRPKATINTARTRSKLLGLFSVEDESTVNLRSIFGLQPDQLVSGREPIDIDMVIDNQGHTALHWACALARNTTVKQLIEIGGADINRGNYAGETALIRSVLTTNHAEQGGDTFKTLLKLLSDSIRTIDHSHKTVLHHICLIAGVKGRASSARIYMANVLEFIAKDSANSNRGSEETSLRSSLNDLNGSSSSSGIPMKTLIDVQDVHGDTALNIAARVGNKGLVKLLLDAGADKARSNKLGLKPQDFGVEVEALRVSPAEAVVSSLKAEVPKPEKHSREVQKNISAIFETINETFASEMTVKQTKLNATEASVRHATKALSEKRQLVTKGQQRLSESEQAKQKMDNVRRAVEGSVLSDWSGRGPLSTEVSDETAVPAAFKLLPSEYAVPPASEEGGEEIALPERGDVNANVLTLRKMLLWEDRILKLLEDRLQALQGESSDKAVKYRKLVSLCTKVPVDKVDGSLDTLTAAIESDGQSIDLSRITGFMARMKDAQSQAPSGEEQPQNETEAMDGIAE